MVTSISPMCVDVKYCADIKYGPHPRNSFDIWLVESDNPTPLVIFYHGGGFVGGDKGDYETEHLTGFLQAGVSFAAVNYRYHTEHDRGILGSVNDCRRALQMIRNKAPQLNIDKHRIGAYGKSAGAGTSLWIAFHDDMADPNNNVPYLRESTRLKVVGALATQATYDFVRWPEFLPVPADLMEDLLTYAVKCYKLTTKRELDEDKGIGIRTALDFLAQMSQGDPPMYVRNQTPARLDDINDILHHPLHAKALKERADAIGLQSYVSAPAIHIEPTAMNLVDFFLQYL